MDFVDLGRTYFPGVDFNNFSDSDKVEIEKDIEQDFREALFGIKQLPASSRGGVYLAYYYYLSGDEARALNFSNLSIDNYYSDLDAFLGEAYLLKGKIMDKQGKRMDAVIAYKKCIKLGNYTYAIQLAKKYLNDPFQQ